MQASDYDDFIEITEDDAVSFIEPAKKLIREYRNFD